MRIEAVLFDADGVLQTRPPTWRKVLQEIVGPGRDPDRFLADIFSAEDPALCGECDFAVGLSEVRRRWECEIPFARLLGVWTMIEVDPHVAQLIQSVRDSGVQCHLATNQEMHRARHMSETLGYRELFDREFYSCALGVAKPAPDFFSAILESTDLQPSSVLFIDDRRENVESARSLGIHGAEYSLTSGASALRGVLDDFDIHRT
jgi:putative hydrolase of the HAD superfamily